MNSAKLWDIFCQVIDNYGDVGVCWRLAADLAARGQKVRLWVDEPGALRWMAPGALQGNWPGVQVRDWRTAADTVALQDLPPADIWVEGFGCTLPEPFVAHRFALASKHKTASLTPPVWINLEYLSAEAFVERSHALPSPILQGPAAGHTRHFFFPGFTARTGGLLREPDLLARQAQFNAAGWLARQGIPWQGAPLWSLFCYEPPALAELLQHALGPAQNCQLLVTHGRASQAVQALLAGGLATKVNTQRLHFLPPLSQADYDHLLWSCDLNFVRGEDSLVRAIWAGKPWVWQIYPQQDDAHFAKLQALMEHLQMPPPWQHFHWQWNGRGKEALQPPAPADWAAAARRTREHLQLLPDLAGRLQQFATERACGYVCAKDAKI